MPIDDASASALTVGKSQLYDIVRRRCNTSIDNLARLTLPLGVRACELLSVI